MCIRDSSWSGQKYSAKTGKDGKWAIKVQTPKASYTPLSITFDDGEKTCGGCLAGSLKTYHHDNSKLLARPESNLCRLRAISLIISSFTILMTICPGLRPFMTSCPCLLYTSILYCRNQQIICTGFLNNIHIRRRRGAWSYRCCAPDRCQRLSLIHI